MPLSLSELRSAGLQGRTRVAKSIVEASTLHLRTAFLCHSHADSRIVEGAVNVLETSGWKVYVDWADSSMPAVPTRTTAAKIKSKIVETDYFLFLATPNATSSRWCPWEIGYADGKKAIEKILIIPTKDDSGNWYGNEYLQLYRKIDRTSLGLLGVFEPGSTVSSMRVASL